MRMPAITVVLPTRDRERLVARAVHSVLSQSFDDIELIVVDDGSADGTAALVQSISDPRVRVLSHPQPLGAAAARNRGIEHARAPLVAFLDDDDEYLPGYLGRMQEAFDRSPDAVGLGWCGIRWVSDEESGERVVTANDVWAPRFATRDLAYRGFLRARRIGTNSGVMLRRSVFDQVGMFDTSLQCAEDTDLLVRVVREFDFTVVPEPLIKVHAHAGPRLRHSPTRAAAYRTIIERNRPALERDAELWTELHYKTGWLHYHAGDRRLGRQFMLRALARRPWHPKSIGALVLFETLGRRAPGLHARFSELLRRWRSRSSDDDRDQSVPSVTTPEKRSKRSRVQ